MAKYIFNMLILIIETYDSQIKNPSIALDNYFGFNQCKLKNWLKTLNYSKCFSLKDFKKNCCKIVDIINSQYSIELRQNHLIFVGSSLFENRENLNIIKNVIIYPFDKSNILKNEFIKEILVNQLSIENI